MLQSRKTSFDGQRKIPDIFTYKEQEVICGILPPIPVNSHRDYTLEKDSFEHVKKYMRL